MKRGRGKGKEKEKEKEKGRFKRDTRKAPKHLRFQLKSATLSMLDTTLEWREGKKEEGKEE